MNKRVELEQRIRELEQEFTVKDEERAKYLDQLEDIDRDMEDWEFPEDEVDEKFHALLNDIHGEYMGMTADYILKECDPTGYDVQRGDFESSLDNDEFKDWRELVQDKKDLEYEIDNLDYEIEQIEIDLEDLRGELEDLSESEVEDAGS